MSHLPQRGPVQVTLENGMLRLRRGNPQAEGLYDPDTTNALRAFFQAERDEQLGRWRDPENPDWVVYPVGDDFRHIRVLNERTLFRKAWSRSEANRYAFNDEAVGATRRYFDARPKPWVDAKPGEVWALTYAGIEETAWVADFTWGAPPRFRQFKNLLNPIFTNDKHITAGRRIWPEGEASE